MTDQPASSRKAPRDPERLVFFSDAVVAIAMTLLVLPLMESVPEAGKAGLSTVDYLHEHSGQLIAFLLSFVLVATNWSRHHALFAHVAAYVPPMALLNMAWLLTIVWLPVPTAMTGSMHTDRLQITLYIGTLFLASVLLFLLARTVQRHPEITKPAPGFIDAEVAVSGAMAILLLLALLLALAFPAISYVSLFVLFLTRPLVRWLRPRIAVST